MSIPLDLTNRCILVTGASSGIGRETAVVLSRLGAKIVLVGRDAKRLVEARSRLEGPDHVVEPFDLSSFDVIVDWVKRVVAKTGALSGLVHCAGVQRTIPLKIMKAADVDDVFRVNVFAALALVKGFRQRMCHTPSSSIVFMSSVRGIVGESACSLYSASKGAIIAMTKSLALELAREGIRVNCVAPGLVETPMIEALRGAVSSEQFARIEAMHLLGLGTPADVANAVAFLLADESRWITGTTLVVDGGYTAK